MADMAGERGEGQFMSRDAYRRWVSEQPVGRFERVEGRVVAMAPEGLIHADRKALIWLTLRRAVLASGLPCHVYPDGVTIEVDDSDFEPDAVLRCRPPLPDDAVAVPDPVLVVEVLSPGTRSVDLHRKLVAYFRIPTLRHYLIFWADRQQLIHHRDVGDSKAIETRIVASGKITLDPPGLTFLMEDCYS